MARRTYGRQSRRDRKRGGKGGAIFLGFLFGFLTTGGAVAGVGYYALNGMSVKTGVNLVNKFAGADLDYKDYITDQYANKTVLGLVGSLQSVADDISKNGGSFAKLNEISPQVKKAVEKMADALIDYGVEMKKDELVNQLMESKFDKLGDVLTDAVYTVQLGTTLDKLDKLDTGNELLMFICYGEEGTDWQLDKDGKVVMLGNSKPSTIEDLASNGMTGILDKLPLSAMLDADDLTKDDTVMLALAYGHSNRYYFDENDNVQMKQQSFTKEEETGAVAMSSTEAIFLDIDENKIAAVKVEDSELYAVMNVDEETQESTVAYYLAKNPQKDGEYLAYLDTELTIPYLYQKTKISALMDDANSLIETIYLGELFDVSPLDPNPDKIMLALAYGDEGTHYVVEEGEIVWLINPETGKHYTQHTVGELIGEGGAKDLINHIKLESVLDLDLLKHYTDDEDEQDSIMLALAYGEEGVHYEYKNGKIEWFVNPDTNKKYEPRTIGELSEDSSTLLDDLRLATVLDVSPLDEDADPIMLALAYGEEGTHYNIVNGEIEWIGDNKARTISDLTDNADEIMNEITLATVLDVSPLDNLDSDPNNDVSPIMLALAYGDEGKHYNIVNGEIEWIGDNKARTIKDLSENSDTLINDVQLSTVFEIKLEDKYDSDPDNDPDAILLALAFGEENIHYEYKNGKIEWLVDPDTNEKYAPRTIASLTEGDGATGIMNEITLATVLDISPLDEDADPIMLSLAYGEEGTHYNIVNGEIEWIGDNKARTIKDLSDNSTALINDVKLSTVFEIDIADKYDDDTKNDPDPILLALAYGEENTHYTYDKTNGITWLKDGEGKEYSERTIGDLDDASDLMYDVKLATVLGISPLDEDADPIMLSLAFGEEGTHYEIVDGKLEWKTKPNSTEKYSERTIRELKDNSTELINDVKLSTVFEIDIKDAYDSDPDNDPDSILLALAYGEKDIHYTYDATNGLQWIGNNKERTIGDLDDASDLMNDVTLGTALDISPLDPEGSSSPILMAIAYGEEGIHYNIVNGEIQYIGDNKARSIKDLSENSETLINGITLGTVFEIELEHVNDSDTTNDPAPIIAALAFGEKDIHYTVTNPTTGAYEYKDDCGPRTINDLMGSGATTLMNEIKLGTVLGISPLDNLDSDKTNDVSPIMLAIAFGEEGIHYNIVNGEIQYINDNEARTVGDLSNNSSTLINDITLGTVFEIELEHANDSDTTNDPDPIITALAFGEKDIHYTVTDPITGEYEYEDDCGPRTIGDLMGSGATDLLNGIKLGTVLGVDPLTADDDTSKLLLALAYGEEGIHYNIVNGEIKWIGDNKARTIKDLSDNSDTLLDEITLATVFEIDIADAYDDDTTNDPDEILLALAYGEEGTHYTYDQTDGLTWIGDNKARTIKDLTDGDGASGLIDGIKLSTMLGINLEDAYDDNTENDPDSLLRVLAFGEEGVHYHYVDGVQWIGENKERTVGDLKDGDIFGEITLASVLDLKPNDNGVMISLAYGRSSHYTIVDGARFVMNPVSYKLINGKVYDENYETVTTVSVNGVYVIEIGENSNLYLKADATAPDVLYAYATEAEAIAGEPSTRVLHKKTTVDDMSTNAESLINDIELGAALGVSLPAADGTSELLLALAFGYEDTHYALDDSGNVTWLVKDATTGQPYAPRTIKDLKNPTEIFDSIRLSTVLDVQIDVVENELIHALAFGYEGTHFELDDDNNVTWLADGKGGTYGYRTIASLKNDPTSLFEDLRLASVLDVTPESHAIIISLAYGEETIDFVYVDANNDNAIDAADGKDAFKMINGSKPHTVKDLKAGGGAELLDSIKLHNIFLYDVDPNKDKIHMFLLYGKEGIHYDVEDDDSVTMRQKRLAICEEHGGLFNEYGHEIFGENETSDTKTRVPDPTGVYDYIYSDKDSEGNVLFTYYLKKITDEQYAPLTEVTDYGGIADFYFVFEKVVDENGVESYKEIMYEERTLGELTKDRNLLSDVSNALTVHDFLGDEANLEDNFVLKHVIDHKIDELPTAIAALTVQELFKENIYALDADGNVLNANETPAVLYQHPETHVWYTTPTFVAGTESTPDYQGTWKYLLLDANGVEKICLISDMDTMIENMKTNVQNATLFTLEKDGLIADDDTLYIPIDLDSNGVPTKFIGDLTINGVLQYIGTLSRNSNE